MIEIGEFHSGFSCGIFFSVFFLSGCIGIYRRD